MYALTQSIKETVTPQPGTVPRPQKPLRSSSIRQEPLWFSRVHQDPDEHVRPFVASLHGKANVCKFTTAGQCGVSTCTTNFTDVIMKMVLLNGLADEDIKRVVLGTTDVDDMKLFDTVEVINSIEIAARVMTETSTSIAASSYKKTQCVAPSANYDTFRWRKTSPTF